MKKLVFFLFLLSFIPLFSDDSDYLDNVTVDPDHATLNYDGKLKIYYDLPDSGVVEKTYLAVVINGNDFVVDSTIEDSGFSYLNNVVTLNGAELYKIIDAEKSSGFIVRDTRSVPASGPDLMIDADSVADEDEVPDTDTDNAETDDSDSESENSDKIWADDTYKLKLIVELDTTSNSDDDETDDSDTESTSTSVPESVYKYITIYFDNKAPLKPQGIEAESGDRRIVLRVTPPADPDDSSDYDKIGKYHVKLAGLFDYNGTEIQTELEYTSKVSSSSYDEVWEFSLSDKDGYKLINNDTDDPKYVYTITVYAEDLAGNTDSNNSLETTGSAITTYGYWSNYKKYGGEDDGKFCFIATAGFGSYFHPNVMILRNFRDKVLAKFEYGRKFIGAYYRLGKDPAKIISKYSVLRSVSRTFLMPLVIMAWLLTTLAGNIILASWVLLFLFFLFRYRKSRAVVLPILIGIFFIYNENLYGVDGEFSFNSSFYYPSNVDDEKNTNTGEPVFKEIGGSKNRYLPSLTFGFALPIPVVKDYVRWSLIGGIGYTRLKGTAIDSNGDKTSDKTEMNFIPLMAEMKFRPVYWFPVWPYATIGIDYYTWWIREKGKTSENGGTFGFHGNFGLLFSLNWLDESSSKKFEESAGITNSTLFVQYRLEKINDFNKKESFDLTDSRFEFGILFEF